jgi:hypothetical protein
LANFFYTEFFSLILDSFADALAGAERSSAVQRATLALVISTQRAKLFESDRLT